MDRKILSRILSFGLICGLVYGTITLGTMTFAYGTEPEDRGNYKEVEASEMKKLYKQEDNGQYNRFTNYVDGYSLNVDQGMTVDMSYSGVAAVLENPHKRIEIYKENTGGNVTQSAYINYSNQFLSNRADHTKEYETQTRINGNKVHILQWSREKLDRVENDKNYYASLEVIKGTNTVYTIFVKADSPFYLNGGYLHLLDEFTTFEPTAAGYMRKAQPVSLDERGWNEETLEAYLHYFSPESPLTWGIFEPSAPTDFGPLHKLESAMTYEFPILLNYSSFENKVQHPNLKERLDNAYKENRILELTLQTPWQAAGEGNMVYDVLDGDYDEFLKNYARTVSEFDHPVLFRLGNEMNGDWCPYSSYNTSKDTVIFKEFYKYIYSLFEEAGADNVIWVWNPNGKSFPDFRWNDAIMYYPGDEYVDIVGLTAYNTGTYYSDEKWTDFNVLYDSLYEEYMRLYDKPMMITEFASSSVGGDKNQWIIDMFSHIAKYENIKVAVWWDGCDWDAQGNIARPYFIDESVEIIQTFKKYLNIRPWYLDVYA